MSLPTSIPAAIVETVILRLLSLFLPGAHGDTAAARDAALHMLCGFAPRNEQELCLAADVVSFELHALEALSRSDDPDIPPSRMLRLRSGAVSLNREAHRARQQLQQMQRAAPLDPPAADTPDAAPTAGQISAEKAVELVEDARRMIAGAVKDARQGRHAGLTYSQALQKRMTAQRLLDKQKRRAAETATRLEMLGPQAAIEAAVPA